MFFSNLFNGNPTTNVDRSSSAQNTMDSSPSTTPPPTTGTSTPKPSFHDRRFPSLTSYFTTQVRHSTFFFKRLPPSLAPTSHPAFGAPGNYLDINDDISAAVAQANLGHGDPAPSHMATPLAPFDALSLESEKDVEDEQPLPLLSHEKIALQNAQPPLTPPLSSSSSTTKLDDRLRNGSSEPNTTTHSRAPSNARTGNALNTLKALNFRRSTFSTPLAPQTSTANATASTFYNSVDSSSLNTHRDLAATRVPVHSTRLTLRINPQKLTSSAPPEQTPPRTPRTLSNESKPSETSASSDGPASNPTMPSEKPKNRKNSGAAGTAVAEAKGKLSVSISAGRGLRTSVDPYLVCQFQKNEYMSRGPRNDSGHASNGDGMSIENLRRGLPIQRTESNPGRPMAIPMKSRQSSQTSMSSRDVSRSREVNNPVWNHDCTFDVVGDHNELIISVYDHSNDENFLGHVRFTPSLSELEHNIDRWMRLEPRNNSEHQKVSGEIHLRLSFQKNEKKHFGPDDFHVLKLIGKGTFGQVFQVRKKDTQRVYAMKVLSKKVIVQKKEIAHTVGERNILVRTAMTDSPFIVGLKFSFQTPTDLYLVTDYMSGGELFWHLQRESRFEEDRAKFYIAELILALQHLHDHDIVYRDLKPENILLDANGHIALCDFGLSKANLTKDATTNTFCGTTEYLAPEVLLDEAGYTKMVDFWSLGVLVFEMVCGWSPFYADDTQQMYKNIAFGKVRFPRDALSAEGREFVKGLLNRNPKHRLGADGDAEQLKGHPFFADIDWIALCKKQIVPPFKPRLKSETDTSNFDPEFTNAVHGVSSLNARAAAAAAGGVPATTPLSPSLQANFKGFTFVDESALEQAYRGECDDDDETGNVFEGDEGWNAAASSPSSSRLNRGDRMSGIQSTSGAEEGMFGAEEI